MNKVIRREEWLKVAEEVNRVFGLDPRIDLGQSDEQLKNSVREAALLAEPDDEDFLSTASWNLLMDLREEAVAVNESLRKTSIKTRIETWDSRRNRDNSSKSKKNFH